MNLFDAFGREIKPERKPEERVLAVASLDDRFSNYPGQGLTPQRLAAIFKESDQGNPLRQAELFEEMEEKDTHLFSVLRNRRSAVTELDFEIEPFSQDKRDREIADFVSDVIFGIQDFETNLMDITDAVGKGYSALELTWGVVNSKNVIQRMSFVHQKRFTWVDSTTPRLLTEDEPSKGIDLPPFKFIFHVHKSKSGLDFRQGLLRVCAWMYLFKNYDIKDWVVFAEVYGMPLRLGKYDPGASKDDKDALIQAVRSLGHDAAGVISKSTEIEFIQAIKVAAGDFFKVFAEFCNAEMSKAVVGQTLSTDQGASGARSLGEVHLKVERRLTGNDVSQIAKTLRRDVVLPLVGFNFGWDAPVPFFRFKFEEKQDLKPEAERYALHLKSGVPISEEHYREKFKLPKPKDGETVIAVSAPGLSASKDVCPQCHGGGPLFNKASFDEIDPRDTPGFSVERLLDEVDMDPMINKVKSLMIQVEKEGGDIREFRDRLLDVYKDMDPTALGNLLQKALSVATLAGRFEANTGK